MDNHNQAVGSKSKNKFKLNVDSNSQKTDNHTVEYTSPSTDTIGMIFLSMLNNFFA